MTRYFSFLHVLVLLSFVLSAQFSLAQEQGDEKPKETTPKELKIGSKAPALDIEHWVSDGDGKFEHTQELKSDKIYVIEFWATWCPPCVASMPHLSLTQAKYADVGVQLISVSDEDLETVEKFLAKPVRGKKDMTYAELTNNYCLTADPDRSVMNDYFRAAGQRGIPCAFIVGKEGLVEWIGHPMSMDKPLEEVIAGTWDREAFSKEREESKQRERAFQTAVKSATEAFGDNDTDEGFRILDEAIANPSLKKEYGMSLKSTRARMVAMHLRGEQLIEEIAAIGQSLPENAMISNQIATILCQKHNQEPLEKEELEAVKKLAEMTTDSAPQNPAYLSTQARVVSATGDLDQAIELQEKAVELAGPESRAIFRKFLDELKSKKDQSADDTNEEKADADKDGAQTSDSK